jgi:hypothetical protein
MKKIIILGNDENGKAITHVYRDKERGIVITNKEEIEEIEELSKNAPEEDLPKLNFKAVQSEYLVKAPIIEDLIDTKFYEKPKSKFHK